MKKIIITSVIVGLVLLLGISTLILGLIPVVNFYIIYLLARRGDKGDNRYGFSAEE